MSTRDRRRAACIFVLTWACACARSNPAYYLDPPDASPDAGADPAVPDAAVGTANVPDAAVSADVAPDAAADLVEADPDLGTSQAPPRTDLIAYWALDEGKGNLTEDQTGNGNDGTLDGATWQPGAPLPFADPAAVLLDGLDDCIALENKTFPLLSGPRTVSLWFQWQWQATLLGGRQDLIVLAAPRSNAGVQVGINGSQLAVWRWSDGVNLITGSTPTPGWHHLAYAFDGGRHSLYLDGQLVASRPTTLPDLAITQARLGCYASDLGVNLEVFAGLLDDVRFYGRALTDAEIAALYAGD